MVSPWASVNEKELRQICGLEFMHCSTLVHDDICDEDQLRRGKNTVVKQ